MVYEPEPLAVRAEPPRALGRSGALGEVARAARWLKGFLAAELREAGEVLRAGAAMGFSRRTLYAAKGRLGVDAYKSRSVPRGPWLWDLPGRQPPPDPVAAFEDPKVATQALATAGP